MHQLPHEIRYVPLYSPKMVHPDGTVRTHWCICFIKHCFLMMNWSPPPPWENPLNISPLIPYLKISAPLELLKNLSRRQTGLFETIILCQKAYKRFRKFSLIYILFLFSICFISKIFVAIKTHFWFHQIHCLDQICQFLNVCQNIINTPRKMTGLNFVRSYTYMCACTKTCTNLLKLWK